MTTKERLTQWHTTAHSRPAKKLGEGFQHIPEGFSAVDETLSLGQHQLER
jgi:hypothetical protein